MKTSVRLGMAQEYGQMPVASSVRPVDARRPELQLKGPPEPDNWMHLNVQQAAHLGFMTTSNSSKGRLARRVPSCEADGPPSVLCVWGSRWLRT